MGAVSPGYYHYSQIKSMVLRRYDSNNYRFEQVIILPEEKPVHMLQTAFKDEWLTVSADGIGTLVDGESHRDYMDFSRLSHNDKV